jgi:hypothetical protein
MLGTRITMEGSSAKYWIQFCKHRPQQLLTSNFIFQADKIQTLIGAAKVEEIEPIWATIFAKVNT